MIALAVASLCFINDGIGLQSCQEVQFEADTVIECATLGDATVPLHINSGTHNPGNGVVIFGTHEPYTNRFIEVGRFAYASRGYTSGGGGLPPSALYIATEHDVLADGMEACACHTRWPAPDRSICT